MSAYINIKKKKTHSTVVTIVRAKCKNTGCTVSKHCGCTGAFIMKVRNGHVRRKVTRTIAFN